MVKTLSICVVSCRTLAVFTLSLFIIFVYIFDKLKSFYDTQERKVTVAKIVINTIAFAFYIFFNNYIYPVLTT